MLKAIGTVINLKGRVTLITQVNPLFYFDKNRSHCAAHTLSLFTQSLCHPNAVFHLPQGVNLRSQVLFELADKLLPLGGTGW